jgi:hypothetical protein
MEKNNKKVLLKYLKDLDEIDEKLWYITQKLEIIKEEINNI